jgi:hypothetical protein
LTPPLFLLIIIDAFNIISILNLTKTGENNAKKNISTAQQKSKEKTRVFKPHVNTHRQECNQKKAQKRPEGTDEILRTIKIAECRL